MRWVARPCTRRFLGFRHPRTGESLRFESRPPPDMARLIAALTP